MTPFDAFWASYKRTTPTLLLMSEADARRVWAARATITPEMLAATALADREPSPADYDLAEQALKLLPPTGHPQALNVLAAMACDLRTALAAHPERPAP